MDELTSTQGIVALAAAGVALIALIGCVVLAVSLRRTRAAQHVVLGDHGDRDLIEHAAELEQAFRTLHDYVDELVQRLDGRLAASEQRLDGAISHRALVRYDAYNEMSGHQSSSLALLDASGSGLVLSSILHREQARLYVKQVHDGRGELQLSPEEEEAIRLAMAGETQGALS
ncbi:MAG: hypothetical protein QOI98_1707 [Solirubrobacteraceae bacterium]|nr:hypothetical protein [Solirubrobacteraceae bacterium]